ncbi:condensation domain-containing protein [Kiloniella sp. b19]|uniref:condensation domain-containing protein n=1 Tax=Kiloniella sp. GXU_MW_B19 TaxID=3141326 RepID=UPI0031CDF07C
MQAAYWSGRLHKGHLGNVSAHLYVEFSGYNIDISRLNSALIRIFEHHDMLRLRISASGEEKFCDKKMPNLLESEDLSKKDNFSIKKSILSQRENWTNRIMNLAEHGPLAMGITLLPDGEFRLHVDTDMIAIDPPSFVLLMEELARVYEQPEAVLPEKQSDYLLWQSTRQQDQQLLEQKRRDRNWWQNRLPAVLPEPSLPYLEQSGTNPVRSLRLHEGLSREQRAGLEQIARQCRVTLSTLMLGAFALVLGRHLKEQRFRLNVPMFWRSPHVPDVDRLIGEFANVLIANIDVSRDMSLREFVQDLGQQMIDLLDHSSYPGVNVMRDLSRHKGEMQFAPVVFTAGVDVPGKTLFSERVKRVFGEMSWAISQGPQVALDAQVAAVDDGILVNWDIRLDALPEDWIRRVFDDYVDCLRKLAVNDDLLGLSLTELTGSSDHDSSTLDMVLVLLKRLTGQQDIEKSQAFAENGLNAAQLEQLRLFLNNTFRSLDLKPGDFQNNNTPLLLARRIEKQTEGHSETIARVFLETLVAAS